MIFGILRKIAMRARLGNRLNDRGALDALEMAQFGLELFKPGACQGDLFNQYFPISQPIRPDRQAKMAGFAN